MENIKTFMKENISSLGERDLFGNVFVSFTYNNFHFIYEVETRTLTPLNIEEDDIYDLYKFLKLPMVELEYEDSNWFDTPILPIGELSFFL